VHLNPKFLTQVVSSAQTYVISDSSVISGPRDKNQLRRTFTTMTSIAADVAVAKNAYYAV
jgi:hypothetical protein